MACNTIIYKEDGKKVAGKGTFLANKINLILLVSLG